MAQQQSKEAPTETVLNLLDLITNRIGDLRSAGKHNTITQRFIHQWSWRMKCDIDRLREMLCATPTPEPKPSVPKKKKPEDTYLKGL